MDLWQGLIEVLKSRVLGVIKELALDFGVEGLGFGV